MLPQGERAALVEKQLGASFPRDRLVRIETGISRATPDEAAALAKVLSRLPVRLTGEREHVSIDDLGLTLDRCGAKRGRKFTEEAAAHAAGY